MTSSTSALFSDAASTSHVEVDGIPIAYRSFGAATGTPPLVLLPRFRATMDDWDPALLDRLARDRRVVLFDSLGVGLTPGATPVTIAEMARVAATTLRALGHDQVDVLGWSMGGVVALALAQAHPALVRRLVIAASSPGGVPNQPAVSPRVWEVASKPVNDAEDFLYLFFPETPDGVAAGRAHLRRLGQRREPASPPLNAVSVRAQLAALQALRGPDAMFPALRSLEQPALWANGHHDVMIPAFASFASAQEMRDGTLILYPSSGHGFLFQHAAQFASDVDRFLTRPRHHDGT